MTMLIEVFTDFNRVKYRLLCENCGKLFIRRKIGKYCDKECSWLKIKGKGNFCNEKKVCIECGFLNNSPISKRCNICRAVRVQENARAYIKQRKI